MRAASEQSIPEELLERIAELSQCLVELTARLQQPSSPGVDEEPARPIEFLTENGFAIVRQWEIDGSPAPTGGTCRFRLSDAKGNARDVEVEILEQLMNETSLHTRGHIQLSSSFWICCAERHLADYVWQQDAFPDDDRLIVESLDPEEEMLAKRWCQKASDF